MELTLEEALQKGIEAHKAGRVQEADRFYTAILQSHPEHPEANHNMGVLAVDVSKHQEALPFFKTAIRKNPRIVQFWLSYIDVLIKLDNRSGAMAVFDQAKDKGIKGEVFDQLEQRINELHEIDTDLEDIGKTEKRSNILDTLTLDQATKLARKKLKDGCSEEAKSLYKDILVRFPTNKTASDGEKIISSAASDAALKKQDPSPEQFRPLMLLYSKGHFQQALNQAARVLERFPSSSDLYNFCGAAYSGLGKLDAAIESYKKALKIKPDFAQAYSNIGIALNSKGDTDAAIGSYKKALNINPGLVEVYINMGTALKNKGDLDAAIDSYKKALKIQPDSAEAYNNMGIALRKKGLPDAAIKSCKKALKINPNFAEAYNNMGVALQTKGDLKAAIGSYNKAFKMNPGDAASTWNLATTAENIIDAKKWIEQCLKIDQGHLLAKLTLAALEFYEGDKTKFNNLMKSALKGHAYMRSFNWAFNLPELPKLYFHTWALFDHIIEQSKKVRPFYEFGVFRGESFQYLIKTFKKGYGFDTFVGLPESWHEEKAGSYSSQGNIPNLEGGEFFAGNFEDSLPIFFSEPRPMASIINFDADLYSSTICALNFAKPVIDRHTILIFDEFIINKNWEQDEYKALNEFCLNNNYSYEVLALSFFTKQVAVRLIGI